MHLYISYMSLYNCNLAFFQQILLFYFYIAFLNIGYFRLIASYLSFSFRLCSLFKYVIYIFLLSSYIQSLYDFLHTYGILHRIISYNIIILIVFEIFLNINKHLDINLGRTFYLKFNLFFLK